MKAHSGSTEYFTGQSWSGDTVYPDFFKKTTFNATKVWWHTQLNTFVFSQKVEFDGLWIDASEATTFCKGQCYQDGSLLG